MLLTEIGESINEKAGDLFALSVFLNADHAQRPPIFAMFVQDLIGQMVVTEDRLKQVWWLSCIFGRCRCRYVL